jgi:hypothetical protein
MGDYADFDDLRPFLGRFATQITESSKPSLSDVDIFIADIESELESAFAARGFVIPLAAPQASADLIEWAKRTIAIGAAAHTIGTLLPETGGPLSSNRDARLWEIYRDRVKLIESGTIIPIVIGGVATQALPRSYETTQGYDPATGEDFEPVFTKHMKW